MQRGMRALPFICLLLGIASSAVIDVCPDEADISPCYCQKGSNEWEFYLSCHGDVTLATLKQALNSLSGAKNIFLGLNKINLGTLPTNFFDGLNISHLDILHCELDSLTDDSRPPLLGLENTLEELRIYNSFTEKNVLAKLQLGHMRKLKVLDLRDNVITEVSDDWFDKGPDTLESLMLSDNGIEKIGSRAFANLINLEDLSINGNSFGSIQRSMLPSSAERLEILTLRANGLTSLPEDLFTGMPSLKDLDLRINEIRSLDQRTFNPIWQHVHAILVDVNPTECGSNMNWIIKSSRIPILSGTCQSPPEVEGESLSEFIKSRRPVE